MAPHAHWSLDIGGEDTQHRYGGRGSNLRTASVSVRPILLDDYTPAVGLWHRFPGDSRRHHLIRARFTPEELAGFLHYIPKKLHNAWKKFYAENGVVLPAENTVTKLARRTPGPPARILKAINEHPDFHSGVELASEDGDPSGYRHMVADWFHERGDPIRAHVIARAVLGEGASEGRTYLTDFGPELTEYRSPAGKFGIRPVTYHHEGENRPGVMLWQSIKGRKYPTQINSVWTPEEVSGYLHHLPKTHQTSWRAWFAARGHPLPAENTVTKLARTKRK